RLWRSKPGRCQDRQGFDLLARLGPVNVSGVAHFDLTWRCRDNERSNMSIETISRGDLEEQLATIRALVPGEAEGPFGPASVTWHVDREAAIFLGAGRALFLQLAHPWVAAAISEHSRTSTDPIGRFHRTFGVVFGMVFGSLEQAFAAARRLHRRHAAIQGFLLAAVGPFAAGS